MKKPQEVDSFVRSWFQEYGIIYQEHFYYFDEKEECHELPLVEGDQLNMLLIEEAARLLGIDVETLLETDDVAAGKWLRKFRYFRYRSPFEQAYKRSFHDSNYYDTIRLMEVIFDQHYAPVPPTRYDYQDVIKRMIALLHEYDKSAPGVYHEGAEIRKLNIRTDNFCHYKDIGDLVSSYIETLDRAEELFFLAWERELCQDEIHEYNFLVTVLGLRDRCCVSYPLYYDWLRALVPAYKEEGYKDFDSYVRVHCAHDLKPWRCAEFVQDRDLVQKYIDIFPYDKPMMRQFATEVSKFECIFTWSDAPLVEFQPDERFEQIFADMNLPQNDPPQETTTIYVPKTAEELSGDDTYAAMLRTLSGPPSKGGLITRKLEYKDGFNPSVIERIDRRVQATQELRRRRDLLE